MEETYLMKDQQKLRTKMVETKCENQVINDASKTEDEKEEEGDG